MGAVSSNMQLLDNKLIAGGVHEARKERKMLLRTASKNKKLRSCPSAVTYGSKGQECSSSSSSSGGNSADYILTLLVFAGCSDSEKIVKSARSN